MSKTLKDLDNRLKSLKKTLASATEEFEDATHVDECLIKTQAAANIASQLLTNPADIKSKQRLTGLLQEIIEDLKNPELLSAIGTHDVDDLKKFSNYETNPSNHTLNIFPKHSTQEKNNNEATNTDLKKFGSR